MSLSRIEQPVADEGGRAEATVAQPRRTEVGERGLRGGREPVRQPFAHAGGEGPRELAREPTFAPAARPGVRVRGAKVEVPRRQPVFRL